MTARVALNHECAVIDRAYSRCQLQFILTNQFSKKSGSRKTRCFTRTLMLSSKKPTRYGDEMFFTKGLFFVKNRVSKNVRQSRRYLGLENEPRNIGRERGNAGRERGRYGRERGNVGRERGRYGRERGNAGGVRGRAGRERGNVGREHGINGRLNPRLTLFRCGKQSNRSVRLYRDFRD